MLSQLCPGLDPAAAAQLEFESIQIYIYGIKVPLVAVGKNGYALGARKVRERGGVRWTWKNRYIFCKLFRWVSKQLSKLLDLDLTTATGAEKVLDLGARIAKENQIFLRRQDTTL